MTSPGDPRGSTPLVYLDHASTTPLSPVALEAMLPYLTHSFGNPSGPHATARAARRALDDARDTLAEALGCQPGEVVFTSGGTEADNLAVLGTVRGAGARGGAGSGGPAAAGAADAGGTGGAGSAAVLVSAVEHKAVLAPCKLAGGEILPVQPDGRLDPEVLAEALERRGNEVVLVSVMLANNETGVVEDLPAIVETVRRLAPRALVHTDAVHAFPWLDVATLAAGCDLVSISAHKFGGPKGAGVLVVRRGAPPRLQPLVHGGGQEAGIRPGTQNVAAAVAMAAAAGEVVRERQATVRRVATLRDRLADGILASCPEASEPAPRPLRTAANCHLSFEGLDGEELCYLLDDAGLAASTGSSCSSGATEPSHVLEAMGFEPSRARGALRLTLGTTTTAGEVARALEIVPRAVERLRAAEPPTRRAEPPTRRAEPPTRRAG
ncbi:MAG TPA: cysteine desulfurase family protein [Acidimicrobiales bacterium]|nr:cysteine desulfurase family protein [Acidimicrobiales bacterium]